MISANEPFFGALLGPPALVGVVGEGFAEATLGAPSVVALPLGRTEEAGASRLGRVLIASGFRFTRPSVAVPV